VRVFVDSDRNGSTGYPVAGIGADYLIENGFLYRYAGSSGSWAWTELMAVSLTKSNGVATWNIPLSAFGPMSSLTAVGNYNSVYSPPLSYTLAAAVINSFAFANVPAQATAGTAFSFTVTAKDQNNNVLTSYAGAVSFSSS